MRRLGFFVLSASFLIFAHGCTDLSEKIDADTMAPVKSPSGVSRAEAIPVRAPGAMTGSEFVHYLSGMTTEQREGAILREYLHGNIPSFLRGLKAIRVALPGGFEAKEGTFWAMPDYLAIGSDADYVYTPMNPLTAQKVADHFGFVLPTRKMVDDIYVQADVKLKPQPMPAGPEMRSTDYFQRHNSTVQKQLGSGHLGELIVGHKKDVVISNRLSENRRRVAIYGWHTEAGRPIQPLSTVHGELYEDYSHGVRLISKMMTVSGKEVPLAEILRDPDLSQMISDEGALRLTRIAVDCRDC